MTVTTNTCQHGTHSEFGEEAGIAEFVVTTRATACGHYEGQTRLFCRRCLLVMLDPTWDMHCDRCGVTFTHEQMLNHIIFVARI